MIIEVTYESNHIYLIHDSTLSNVLDICFYLFYCNLKGKGHIRPCQIDFLFRVIRMHVKKLGTLNLAIKKEHVDPFYLL